MYLNRGVASLKVLRAALPRHVKPEEGFVERETRERGWTRRVGTLFYMASVRILPERGFAGNPQEPNLAHVVRRLRRRGECEGYDCFQKNAYISAPDTNSGRLQ